MINSNKDALPASLSSGGMSPLVAWSALPRAGRLRFGLFAAYLGILTLAYSQTAIDLLSQAFQNDLHSHLPVIPLVSGYLLYLRRDRLAERLTTNTLGGVAFAVMALAILVTGFRLEHSLGANDYLAVKVASYLAFVLAGVLLFFGRYWVASNLFPLAFLVFMIPLPDRMVYALEHASVLASADVSALFLEWTRTPYMREGTLFMVPGFAFHVAQECSGIRSSWVLLITTVLASNLFLTDGWRRALLVFFVVPLAIVRNAFRILVIALLCVHVGPHMIDSFIHRRGGPIFFALSLIPLFAVLLVFRSRELRVGQSVGARPLIERRVP